MREDRRAVLAAVGGVLATGCSGTGSDPGDGASPTRTDVAATEPSTAAGTPDRCDPADVVRPPVATGGNLDGKPYPAKPATLTDQSVLEYLADFETAFAWNRVLERVEGTVTSLNVDTLDGFSPDETGDGYLASSGMRVSHSTDDTDASREYVATYFVAPGPVYRVESPRGATETDPRAREQTQLVQCGADSGSERFDPR